MIYDQCRDGIRIKWHPTARHMEKSPTIDGSAGTFQWNTHDGIRWVIHDEEQREPKSQSGREGTCAKPSNWKDRTYRDRKQPKAIKGLSRPQSMLPDMTEPAIQTTTGENANTKGRNPSRGTLEESDDR
jgi:hypothetical protein